ncbi:hypothetical protein M9435_004025 [Picochlorum sp. BPE23]|nr:hypothetical protein M9435_004025 [Picochlorum sp. BPE23]
MKKKSKIHPLPCGRSVEEIASWLYRKVKQEKSKVALLASLGRMTGLSIPRQIKERIISESFSDRPLWKCMSQSEVQVSLNATREIVKGTLMQEEYERMNEPGRGLEVVKSIKDFFESYENQWIILLYNRVYKSFHHGAVIGCFYMVCFQGRNFDRYEQYARLFHPHLFRRLQSMTSHDNERRDIYDQLERLYETDVWGMMDGNPEFGHFACGIFRGTLARLGYGTHVNLDSIAGLTKWQFMNGFVSFLFESWIPNLLLSAIQEREGNYQRLKKALEDMYGADVVVPDLESILRNKQEWPLSYGCVVRTLRLGDFVKVRRHCGSNFKGTLGTRFLDFQSGFDHEDNVQERIDHFRRSGCKFEKGTYERKLLDSPSSFSFRCSLPPNSKILGMLTDPAWLAKFPSVQSYLKTDDIDRLREGLIRGVHKCISMGISEVDLSYTTHPQVSALFDMSSQQGRRRRNYVRYLVAIIFEGVSNRLGNKKRVSNRLRNKRLRLLENGE